MASTKKTSKKAGAKKSAKKSLKKAAKKGGGGGQVSHPPIIITDGSASFEFEDPEYPQVSATTHQSTGLKLSQVRSNKQHDDGTFICHTLANNERVLIVVTCKVGGTTDPKTINFRGGNFTNGSGSPSFDFDHGAFNETFTPIEPGNRRRVGKNSRDITRLEIFRGNTRIHDCTAITRQGFRIRVVDAHI